jgi:hypothetical protein
MLIKINNKPIKVTKEEDEKPFSPVYLGVTCVGYLLILSLLDYICYIFFHTPAIPFISWIWRFFL